MTRDERVTWWLVTSTFLAAWWMLALADVVAFSWWGAALLVGAAFIADAILLGETLKREWCPW